MKLLRSLCVSLIVAFSSFACVAEEVPTIAAAANIKFAMDKIVTQFTQDTGKKVRVSYGSSGNFVAQIRHGAPFELFLSADEKYIHQLNKLGVVTNEGDLYAIGRLALAAPKSSPLTMDADLAGLRKLLKEGKLKRFAIAHPDHAPYGERARELLKNVGLWSDVESHLIYGENVAQAAQFALSGSTDGGIVALALAMAPQFQATGHYVALPDDLYSPMNQRMVLTERAGDTAKLFYQYIQQERARAVFAEFGFGLPALGK